MSVIVPSFNARDYLRPAIGSILSQTHNDFEVIVVDDYSSDDSSEIAADALANFKNGRVIPMPKQSGVAECLNYALSLTDSEFVARLDADDWMHPNRLQRQQDVMVEIPELAVLGTWVRTFGGKNRTWRFPANHPEIIAEMGFHNCIVHPSVMMKRRVLLNLEQVYRANFVNSEDWDLWERISRQHKLANLPEVLTWYRIHPNQVTRTNAESAQASKDDIRRRFRENVGWGDLWDADSVSVAALIRYVNVNHSRMGPPATTLVRVGLRVIWSRICRRVRQVIRSVVGD